MNTHLIHGPLGPPESTSQTAFRSAHPFLQGSRHIFTIFYSGPGDAPHKKPVFLWGGDPTPPHKGLNMIARRFLGSVWFAIPTWFVGPARVHSQTPTPSRHSLLLMVPTGLARHAPHRARSQLMTSRWKSTTTAISQYSQHAAECSLLV